MSYIILLYRTVLSMVMMSQKVTPCASSSTALTEDNTAALSSPVTACCVALGRRAWRETVSLIRLLMPLVLMVCMYVCISHKTQGS